MNRQQLSLLCLLMLFLIGCGGGLSTTTTETSAATSTAIPPTVPPVPTLAVTTEANCWTVVTMIEQGTSTTLGGTSVEIKFIDYFYNGVVGGDGFLMPTGGSIEEVHVGGRPVTLNSQDFNEGFIDTVEFGKIEVLFTASLTAECAVLVATSEQLVQIAAWVQ